MFNVYKNQPSLQTGSRNLTGPKKLPTIWHIYMKLVIYAHFSKNQYQNVKINGIMFIMKNFTGQKFEIILKDWTSVIKLKNSNGNATITLFTPKVDLEK
jgi:hypothetical protein